MKRILASALAWCLVACGATNESGGARSAGTHGGDGRPGTSASASHDSALPIPPEGQPHIQRAISVGRILHAYDLVAAEGTDVMLANTDVADRASIGGYLVQNDEAGWTVAFFTKDADPRIFARITVVPGQPSAFQRLRPAEPASAAERTAIRARQAAIAAVPEIVQPLNPVVLTGAHALEVRKLAGELDGETSTEAKSVVYLLAGTTRPNVAVLGRHYRAIARAGGAIEKIEPMSKGVIEISAANVPKGAQDVGLVVTHLLSDWPTEAHVFASLLYRKSVGVITARGVFSVEGDRIRRIR